ncbi:low molecular weight protein-tyrosine-phosphatase [Actinosynnema mirum]|uniref:protein-tyrosine-phosphatase n=1 Tax=Actinosynnema mirum (strain ATCC 29888 / DSM 43827 / JCM 3225 / NBRC 14064 / NCIMB 13271 / NRRL B-12336 / IMRU 3971 / 101) TaxID=446462 RepID=C6WMA2_ACTMD|nr:low molecular weight protein-tyrosine-phosphatase [Actinosynnema mirum]ACU34836.1 protein tyrosine phosphatase [Actinosynnema mirum DSM 43827]
MLSVVFVCTGNICRSPVAEIVLREHLRRAGVEGVVVSSAGLQGYHVGEPADERSAATLERAGYPTGHVAAKVSAEDLDADLLVALDSGHARALRGVVADPERVRLLRSFDPEAGSAEVPDPYYSGRAAFAEVLGMVEAAVPGLLRWVRERQR